MRPPRYSYSFADWHWPIGSRKGPNAWTCRCSKPRKSTHSRTERRCQKCGQRRPDGMK